MKRKSREQIVPLSTQAVALFKRAVELATGDLILHHARPGVTASHYDFSTLDGPVRKALQSWSDHVHAVAGQSKHQAPSNIYSLADARAG